MADMTLQSYLSEVRAREAAAHRMICDLAKNGGRNWSLSIPVQSYDSDMVLQAPLNDLAKLVEALEIAVEALDKFNGEGSGYTQDSDVDRDTSRKAKLEIERIVKR